MERETEQSRDGPPAGCAVAVLAGGAVVFLALVALVVLAGHRLVQLVRDDLTGSETAAPAEIVLDVPVAETPPAEAPPEVPAGGLGVRLEDGGAREKTGEERAALDEKPDEPDAERVADADHVADAAALEEASRAAAVEARRQEIEARRQDQAPPVDAARGAAAPTSPRPASRPDTSADAAPRRLTNTQLGARLQGLSPRIQEVRFAMSGGRRHPRIVLRADTDDAQAFEIARQVLVTFLSLETGLAGPHGTVVYVDLPPEARTGRQTLEPFALRQLRVRGQRLGGRGDRGLSEPPYDVIVSEVHERNDVAMCCRTRRVGEIRDGAFVP